MKELFRCLKEDGINPDVTTYALLLSCLGQQEVSENNTQIIRLYLEELKKEVRLPFLFLKSQNGFVSG